MYIKQNIKTYPGSRLLTSTKMCFQADLWKYQILAVPSLDPLRNLAKVIYNYNNK